MIRNRLLLTLIVLALLAASFCALAESADGNLLLNGDFSELDADGLPVGWWTDAYFRQEGYTLFGSAENGRDGNACVSIENVVLNDARFAQTVEVEPESMYLFSGWLRTEDVGPEGHGANLSVEGVYIFSTEYAGTTNGWQYVELYGETGEDQTEVTVFARLGGYSGESTGKVWFDQLSLTKVDTLPGDQIAPLWFSIPRDDSSLEEEEEDSPAGQPFWPWLIALSLVWCGLAGLVLACFRRKDAVPAELGQAAEERKWLLPCGLALSALLQLVIAYLVDGYQVDVNCFVSWGSTMRLTGAPGFYEASGFCDYPPAYLYILGLASSASEALQRLFAGLPFLLRLVRPTVLLKLCPIAANLLMAWLIVHRAADRRKATALALLVAFHPALILNSAAWCQMDSVLCLLLMLVAILAIEEKWLWVMPVYMLAVLVKPQALMLGFLGLAAIILALIRNKKLWKPMLIGVGVALAAALAVILPFALGGQEPGWLIRLYTSTLASYPYATINTANLYYLFGGNWSPIEQQASVWVPVVLTLLCAWWSFVSWRRNGGKPCRWLEPALAGCFAAAFAAHAIAGSSWQAVGFTAMALAFALVLPMYVRGGKTANLPLLGGLLFLLLYVLGIKMHERYLFPAVIFFAMAFLIHRDERILLLLAVTGCTLFINEGIVLDNSLRLGSSMGHLNRDTYWLTMLLAMVNTACVPLALWTAQRCVSEGAPPFSAAGGSLFPCRSAAPAPKAETYRPDPSLHWKKLDTILMLSVTLIYSAVALWNLGSTKAPQQPWKSSDPDETVTLFLGADPGEYRVAYFAQVSYDDFTVAFSDDGEHWTDEYWCEMAEGQCFHWKYLVDSAENGSKRTYYNNLPLRFSSRYVRVSAQQVGLILNEMIFRRDDGSSIAATVTAHDGGKPDSPLYSDGSGLVDEPDTLEGEPGWYNGTYFDEIYHARTAFEHINGTTPYETTHPPLGKLMMSLSVLIFGMTPFGWRFAGALVGILMLPVMYLLGKQLTKKTLPAFAAMTLMALDCMHLTQTRIATIDSFPVFFILCSYLFMLRFMQRERPGMAVKKLLPDLLLSGFFMGCAVASKWIGIYAGIGLAVLFFWTLLRRFRMDRDFPHALRVCLWCLLFFVAVPAGIYLLCYIPYFAYAHVTGLGDFIRRVIRSQENMLAYHATPGLGMDHPFYSPWYEWPLIRRPMYYAAAQYMPDGYSCAIFCFGNPAVWLPGLAGIAGTLAIWLLGHRYRSEELPGTWHAASSSDNVAAAFILLGLLAQFLPWTLVPRGTYIYHYFASVPFLCLGTALTLHRLTELQPKAGRWITIVYLAICLLFFLFFYPYASGVTTPVGWLDLITDLRLLSLYHA